MAKKKKPTGAAAIKTIEDSPKVNKSSLIRAYSDANPGVGPTAIAKALTEHHGSKFSPSLVSNVLGNGKAKAGTPKGKPGRKAKDASGARNETAGPIELAAKLVQAAGSMAEAKKALQTVEDIHNWARSLKTPF